jgi:hypothetical protein
MDSELKNRFLTLWGKYFKNTELPFCFYYTDDDRGCAKPRPTTVHRCVIGDLVKVRRGTDLCFEPEVIGCAGGRRYFGFAEEFKDDFPHYLSCGIPGKLAGERYMKTPDLVRESMQYRPHYEPPGKYLVFKRWDNLSENDAPEAVIFFAPADVLSGLFTLANFDEAEPNSVFAPFCAGCGSIVQYPYVENRAERPRAVLGMFDVSARPYVPGDTLSFTVPMRKFSRMIGNMEESFLITSSWDKVKKRLT